MNPDRDKLAALFAGKLDGTISEEDHALLDRLLLESAEARRQWFLHCDLETGMADWAATRQAQREFMPSLPSSAPSFWRRLAPIAAAALLMFGAVWWWARMSPGGSEAILEPKANGVALLSRAVGVEWADGVDRTAGSVLEPGTLRLKSGAALVEFYSGARLIVEAPAELQLLSAGEAFLVSGRINAHVPPQAEGFTVNSPTMKVVDRGTDFGFSIGSGGAPEVHVFKGKVEVNSATIALRALQTGEAVRLDGSSLQTIPAARAGFVTEEELTRRDAEAGIQRLAAWRAASSRLSADPATVIHYVFDDAGARSIANQRAGAAPDSQGNIIGSAWTEGRWPGKKALQFRSESDRVRFTAAQPMTAMTLLAWVRLDALPRWQNVLLASDSEQPGALRWHVTRSGQLRLEIGRDLGRPHVDWEAVNSAPFVTSDRTGQWLMLATTFDGTTIRHYGNGQLIGSGASFTPPALHAGTAELGNWRGDTQRQLAGAFDEFASLSRVMSDAELRAIFQTGKP